MAVGLSASDVWSAVVVSPVSVVMPVVIASVSGPAAVVWPHRLMSRLASLGTSASEVWTHCGLLQSLSTIKGLTLRTWVRERFRYRWIQGKEGAVRGRGGGGGGGAQTPLCVVHKSTLATSEL